MNRGSFKRRVRQFPAIETAIKALTEGRISRRLIRDLEPIKVREMTQEDLRYDPMVYRSCRVGASWDDLPFGCKMPECPETTHSNEPVVVVVWADGVHDVAQALNGQQITQGDRDEVDEEPYVPGTPVAALFAGGHGDIQYMVCASLVKDSILDTDPYTSAVYDVAHTHRRLEVAVIIPHLKGDPLVRQAKEVMARHTRLYGTDEAEAPTVRNGIRVTLQDRSYFGPGTHPVMHFTRLHGDYRQDSPHPEVCATKCFTPLEDFCAPDNARYEFAKREDGNMEVKVFVEAMPKSPVLHWVFPSPDSHYESVYQDFYRGL